RGPRPPAYSPPPEQATIAKLKAPRCGAFFIAARAPGSADVAPRLQAFLLGLVPGRQPAGSRHEHGRAGCAIGLVAVSGAVGVVGQWRTLGRLRREHLGQDGAAFLVVLGRSEERRVVT